MPRPTELIVTGPDNEPRPYVLSDKPLFTIGRHPECDIVVNDPMVGRKHCKIERTADGFKIQDNKSANGTILNDAPMSPQVPVLLKNGDKIQIGSTMLVLREDVMVRNVEREPARGPIVEMEEGEASFDLALKADAQLVSEEEAKSSDPKLKRLAERLKLLVDVAQSLGTSLDPDKLLNGCLDKLFQVFKYADRGLIVLYGPDGEPPKALNIDTEKAQVLEGRKNAITRVKFRNPQQMQGNEIRLSRTVLKRVRTQQQAVLVSDSGSDAGESKGSNMSLVAFEIKSLMCCPLLIGKHDLGIIQLETKNPLHPFNQDDLGVLAAVAGQIAVVIRNSDLARQHAAEAAHRENLGRFLSPQLLDQVLKGTLNMGLLGEDKRGTTFFSDIVGFTKLAGKMNAQDVVKLLNRYFSVMQNIVFKRGGSIDKCAGDEIMAHWGIVGEMPAPTASAVTAAVEMQVALFDFNRDQALKNEIVLPPVPLGHGIGLNTGIVCAGNIGSERKIEFTVIGDAVNRGSRIAHISGRDQIFIGMPTWEEIKERTFCFRLPDCPFKNVPEPLPVYSVRGIVPPSAQEASSTSTQHIGALHLDHLLFCLPCNLSNDTLKASGMVTKIHRAPNGSAKILLQCDKQLALGTAMTLEWNVLEKPSLPPVTGEVSDCWTDSAPITAAATGSTPTLDMRPGRLSTLGVGTLVLSVKVLPPEIAEWQPGALLQSDLTSHEDIIRA